VKRTIIAIVLGLVSVAFIAGFGYQIWRTRNPVSSSSNLDPTYEEVTGVLEDAITFVNRSGRVKFTFKDKPPIELTAADFVEFLQSPDGWGFASENKGKLIELTIRRDSTGNYLESFILRPPPLDITNFTRGELARAQRDQTTVMAKAAQVAEQECRSQGIDPESEEGLELILDRVSEAHNAVVREAAQAAVKACETAGIDPMSDEGSELILQRIREAN
jgi:hypothetical protein